VRLLSLLLLFVFASVGKSTNLCEEVRLALADSLRLPKEERPYWRYLSSYSARDQKEQELWEQIILAFQMNSLSREKDFGRAVKVGKTLYRVNLLYYGIDPKRWEKFRNTNPYFPCFENVKIVPVVPAKTVEIVVGRVYVFRNGFELIPLANVKDGEKVYEKSGENSYREIERPKGPVAPIEIVDPKDVKLTSFLPAKELQELANTLQTSVPLIRTDWFFYRTAISVNRKGDGYFDFLELTHRDDAYKLAALDLEIVKRLRFDMAAMIAESDVAVNRNRQVWWLKTYIGSYWVTMDVNSDPVGKKNLLRLTGEAVNKVDFDHDAEEAFFHLPNGLWAVIANDAKGVLQTTVPDNIASDDTSTSRDKRIHSSLSCFRCHDQGLKDIDDWAKQAFRRVDDPKREGQLALFAKDPKKQLRLQQLYLSDMPEQLKLDQQLYALKLKKLNGLTPQANAQGIRDVWRAYADTSLDLADCARELGVSKDVWEKALTRHVTIQSQAGNPVDIALSGSLKGKKIIRVQAEELYSVMQAILAEGKP